MNSAEVTGLTVLLICSTGSMAAYALVRQSTPALKWISAYFLATTTLPIQLFLFPLYFGYARLGLIDNVFALSLVYTAIFSPFSIFLLRTYFLAIPRDIEEAAIMDGANRWQVFYKICLPHHFAGPRHRRRHLWPQYLERVPDLVDLPAEPRRADRNRPVLHARRPVLSDWGEIMAAAIIIVAPAVVFFLAMQRRFIEGMASGSVKG